MFTIRSTQKPRGHASVPPAHPADPSTSRFDCYRPQSQGARPAVVRYLNGDFRVEAVEDALAHFGSTEIFDTDQGARFTGSASIDVLERAGAAPG